MAVTYLTSAASSHIAGSAGTTLSISLAPGSTISVAVGLVGVNGTGTGVSGVTYGGQAMTLLTSVGALGGITGARVEIWYKLNPLTGTQSMVATFDVPSDLVLTGMAFSGTDYTTATFGTPTTTTALTTSSSQVIPFSIAAAVGDLIADVYAESTDTTGQIPSGSATRRSNIDAGGNGLTAATSTLPATSTSQSQTWKSFGVASQRYSYAGVALKAGTPAGTTQNSAGILVA